MTYPTRMSRRRLLLLTLTVAAAMAAVVAAGASTGRTPYRTTRSAPQARPAGTLGKHAGPSPAPPAVYTPPRVRPVSSAVQDRTDQRLAAAGTPAALSAAEAAAIPAAVDSAAYPASAAADRNDPSAYAVAFATELLDRDYTRQSRAQLLAWAQSEEAPNTLPGVPSSVADKALVLSLDDPVLPGASPVPSATEWHSMAQTGDSQTVSGLQAQVDPDWTALIATGWQPTDPAMTVMAVTGVLAVRHDDHTTVESVAMTIMVGSARLRPGYGAVAVDDWTVN